MRIRPILAVAELPQFKSLFPVSDAMGLRSILVSLSRDTRDSAVLDLASRAANIDNAVVTALYTEEAILRTVPQAGWPMPQAFGPVVDLSDESWNALKAELNERRANAARHFNTWQERW